MELFTYFRSSAAYRVRIALNYKGIAYTPVPVNLVKGEHRAAPYRDLNPQGLVPSLRMDDGKLLTQSGAILEWLEENYPSPALLPGDSFQRGVVRGWVNLIGCDIHPIDNLRVLNYLTGELGISDQQKQDWYHHWIRLGFEALESKIEAAPYCWGEQVTLADVYLVPQVYNALRFSLEMTPFPKIQSVYQSCNDLASFASAYPDAQPDNPKNQSDDV